MITDRSYYKSIIQIPNVEPSLSSTLLGTASVVDFLIEEFERETLIDVLGYSLYAEFQTHLEVKPNELLQTVITASPQKWHDLMTGKSYTKDGQTVRFPGIIFTQGLLKRSIIAYRVYCMLLMSSQNTLSATGTASIVPEGANKVSPILEYTYSWNKFVELAQEGNNGFVSLYQFIYDTNNETPDTYANWCPKWFQYENRLGF